jgi:hypothetical protein
MTHGFVKAPILNEAWMKQFCCRTGTASLNFNCCCFSAMNTVVFHSKHCYFSAVNTIFFQQRTHFFSQGGKNAVLSELQGKDPGKESPLPPLPERTDGYGWRSG